MTAATDQKGGGRYNETYEYDPIGNLIVKGDMCLGYGEAPGSGDCYSAPATGPQPHAVKMVNNEVRFTYDANGNMTRRIEGSQTYHTPLASHLPASQKLSRRFANR